MSCSTISLSWSSRSLCSLDQELGITDDVDKEDMGDFQAQLIFCSAGIRCF